MYNLKQIAILGSTGSIGVSALDIIGRYPEHFRVAALAAGRNMALLAQQVARHSPALVAVADAAAAAELRRRLEPGLHPAIEVGEAGLLAVAAAPGAAAVLVSVVGSMGLQPTLQAIAAGKSVLLANKETLVAGGSLVMPAAAARGVQIIPVDSEHSALFQCLRGEDPQSVRRLILTASGGPFRGKCRAELATVSVAEALNHPRWRMGKKVTIDSATLMNKALEIIEAHWLFAMPPERIDVLVHPQSIVHSLVEFYDGSVLAQLGITDMRLPILYALSYPERMTGPLPALDLAQVGSLTFEAPDSDTFPSLNYAKQAITMGGTMPAVLNAANEVAVERFLAGTVPLLTIFDIVARVLERHAVVAQPDLAAILAADAWARSEAARLAP